MYSLFKRLLFLLAPETAHEISIDLLAATGRLRLHKFFPKPKQQKAVHVLGMEFPNAIGLAAGLDKNGDAIDALGSMGFGYIEVGTVTPESQPGNPKPRLFRLTRYQAIINRMGFNNKGVKYLVQRLKHREYQGIVGVNIGKNKTTPEENAAQDYLACLEQVYSVADYIVINLSSPNTPGLRDLQFGDQLKALIAELMGHQKTLDKSYKHKPILIKVAPDLSDEEIEQLASTFLEYRIEGIVATNTTVDRVSVQDHELAGQTGGLSGSPLRDQSNHVIRRFRELMGEKVCIIGVGGVLSERDAEEKLSCGADLVQVYSGFIYEGPKLIRDCVERLAK